jgi:hypothetical protein
VHLEIRLATFRDRPARIQELDLPPERIHGTERILRAKLLALAPVPRHVLRQQVPSLGASREGGMKRHSRRRHMSRGEDRYRIGSGFLAGSLGFERST